MAMTFLSGCTEISEEIVFEVAGTTSKVGVVFLGEVGDLVEESEELRTKPAK